MYLIDVQVYRGHPELLVFVDETGADRCDCMRHFGYIVCVENLPELKNCYGMDKSVCYCGYITK